MPMLYSVTEKCDVPRPMELQIYFIVGAALPKACGPIDLERERIMRSLLVFSGGGISTPDMPFESSNLPKTDVPAMVPLIE